MRVNQVHSRLVAAPGAGEARSVPHVLVTRPCGLNGRLILASRTRRMLSARADISQCRCCVLDGPLYVPCSVSTAPRVPRKLPDSNRLMRAQGHKAERAPRPNLLQSFALLTC